MNSHTPNTATPPRGVDILPGTNDGAKYAVESRVAISGERLADAKAGFNQQTNEPIVSFTFDSQGARQFAEITRDNVGLTFAIVLDGKVLTAPRINEPIEGGRGMISGNFEIKEALALAAVLENPLEAPPRIVDEKTF